MGLDLITEVDLNDEKKSDPLEYNQSNNKPNTVNIQVASIFEEKTASRTLADKCDSLSELRETVLAFSGCKLKEIANKTVFGEGTTDSKIMLIGEAPGQNEDKQGRPFCGESGKLLDKMLSSIGLSREKNVYITNTVFWRPPGNRRPTTEEINMCKPFVEKHISIINPCLIVLVGSTAATSLLGDHVKISTIRQEYYSYKNRYMKHDVAVTAIFHPAYLLRQPQQKKTSWYDLLKIKEFIENHGLVN